MLITHPRDVASTCSVSTGCTSIAKNLNSGTYTRNVSPSKRSTWLPSSTEYWLAGSAMYSPAHGRAPRGGAEGRRGVVRALAAGGRGRWQGCGVRGGRAH